VTRLFKNLLVGLDRYLFGGKLHAAYAGKLFSDKLEARLSADYPFGIGLEYDKSLLNALCDKYGSDKGEITSDGNPYDWPSHSYADCYELLFQLRRNDVKTLVECGIGTTDVTISANMGSLGKPGASLRVWRDYFPIANVIGLDIDPSVLFEEDRIKTYQCDQTSRSSVERFLHDSDLAANSVDIIIDDGLHQYHAGVALFEAIRHCLSDDGLRMII